MAVADSVRRTLLISFLFQIALQCSGNDILGCGGFVKSHVNLDFSKIEIGLYTKEGSLKEKTECAPTNGYYFLPLYEKGEYVLKVQPPAGWSFEPSKVDLVVDGVTDQCSTGQDVNFSFNGFGITGKVVTAGQQTGPAGITVQLVNENGEVWDTKTSSGGDFHFTPVIPGKFTVKASHPRWKLEPSQAIVQVKEGNTALPIGALAVKGYDVTGSVTSYGNPIAGVYVLLYSKEANPKFRIEGCNTALLQGVPDAPICHSTTDSSGEFKFGLVPAGEYKLLALSKSPGQASLTYNIRPDAVPFTVRHDSLFVRNAFEVVGYTVVGSVLRSVGGSGMAGARVTLDGEAAGVTDNAGKYTLPALQPRLYQLVFEHEQCQISPIAVSVSPDGAVSVPSAVVAKWRVCGTVSPPHKRTVAITAQGGDVTVGTDDAGKWCTYLPPGVYTAKVEVHEQEQRDGLQFYPLTHKISVSNEPVDGISFSQLKATLEGEVQCKIKSLCEGLPITIRPLSPDGGYVGKPLTTSVKDGKYTVSGVLPGSVEVSVGGNALCWSLSSHNVLVSVSRATVPAFVHSGYSLRVQSTHDVQVEYTSTKDRGVLSIPAGPSEQCVSESDVYTFTPTGCHKFQPPTVTVDTRKENLNTVYFIAVTHAVVIRVTSPDPAADVILKINTDGHGRKDVGPLTPLDRPNGGYTYEHTVYMKENEIALVSAYSSGLLFDPAAPTQVIGTNECQPKALTLRARRGLVLEGKLEPPVPDVTVTLTAVREDTIIQTLTTGADGKYRFGPLEATRTYKITCEKESYVFSEPDDKGDIRAHKLAQIHVNIVDDADEKPLQGALVSVSGGSYRRNLVSGESGSLRFTELSPLQYYVKPLMKEYRFRPPHHILHVEQGNTHTITLRGVRVSWSCMGTLLSVSERGAASCTLLAVPTNSDTGAEEATTDSHGHFRIRGLIPDVEYTIQLKDCAAPELQGLRLARAPPTVVVKNNKDIENVRLIAIQPYQLTDTNVLVYTPNVDHYKHLRISLALEHSPHSHLYSTKLDPAGYSQSLNPGLMYVLPRLPADNKTYVLQLESTLSKATHQYEEIAHYFTSDGRFKNFRIDFLPKVKSSDQELRQTSLLVIPLLIALVIAFLHRDRIIEKILPTFQRFNKQQKVQRPTKPDVLDKASIDHILSTVNAAGKRQKKKQ